MDWLPLLLAECSLTEVLGPVLPARGLTHITVCSSEAAAAAVPVLLLLPLLLQPLLLLPSVPASAHLKPSQCCGFLPGQGGVGCSSCERDAWPVSSRSAELSVRRGGGT